MKRFGKFICKNRKLIVIISFVLLLFSFIGMRLTKINYDILIYLPRDFETVKGQDILTNDFDLGAFSVAIVDNMKSKDILKLEEEIKSIDGVANVVSIYDGIGNIPLDALPSEITDKLHNENTDLLFITYEDSTSSESTIKAVTELKKITGNNVNVGGMSSMVVDTMDLSEREVYIYIVIATILCIIVLELALDSYFVPILLLVNIGFAVLFNMGTNIFLGEISYITKALVAVLQLGVTTDFSIFLYHSYEKNKERIKDKEEAMIESIAETFTSVTGSSLTTIAGFLVLCTMTLTLGKDLGIVMAKGVLLGVIAVLTLFPSLLLMCDNLITKTKHKEHVPSFNGVNRFVTKHKKIIFTCFILLIIPMYLGYTKVETYFKLDRSMPKNSESIVANERLKNEFGIISTNMILVDKNLKSDDINSLVNELEEVKGVDFVFSAKTLNNYFINLFDNDKYELLIFNSNYDIATDELNEQIGIVNDIVKKYDNNAIVAGEGPLMKDLIDTSDKDFRNVNYSSIICIFIILFIVLRSISLPILLIFAIEFAIFTNQSISYLNGTILPFVAPIVLGTIQLGATIDYAILLSTNYIERRKTIENKEQAMNETLNYAAPSIFISGMCFFAATIGVGLYSKLELVGSLCTLISRGAVISMLSVILVLPSILLIFDKLIIKTTLRKGDNMKNKFLKFIAFSILLCISINANALTKTETIYTKLNSDGSVKSTSINAELINNEGLETIEDYSILTDIINTSNDNTFTLNGKNITWNAKGKNVMYEGKTNRRLPIEVKVTYYLNDEEKELNDILGKSGNVKIKLTYKNNDSHNVVVNGKYEILYTPFVVTTASIIDEQYNSNIEVNNGKTIDNGMKQVVIGISSPGLYQSFKLDELKDMDTVIISFDTTNFELPTIYSVVTTKLIDTTDLKLFSKMDTLYSKISELQKGMNKIDEGSNLIKKGSNELKNNLGTSIKELKNNKTDALTDEQIEAIKEEVIENIKNTYTDEYKEELGEAIWEQVKETAIEKVNVKSEVISSEIVNYLKSVGEYDDYLLCEKAKEILEEKGIITEEMQESCKVIEEDIVLPRLENALTKAMSSVAGAVTKLALSLVENYTKRVTVTVSEQTAIEVAGNVTETLAPEIANRVKDEIVDTFTNKLDKLYDGISKLDSGINQLSDGITTYNKQGINKITSLSNSARSTSETLKELSKLNDYTFTGKTSSTTSNSKLIMIIDSVKEEKKKDNVDTTPKKLSLWDRIVNLFK